MLDFVPRFTARFRRSAERGCFVALNVESSAQCAMNEDVPDQFPVHQRGPTAPATRIGIAPSLPRPLDECRAVDVA
jgi:hypothetical protein